MSPVRSVVLRAGVAAWCAALGLGVGSSQQQARPAPERQALVYPFALASHAEATPGPSAAACPAAPATPGVKPKVPDTIDPRIVPAISAELQKRLAKKMTVTVATAGSTPAPGTLLFSGCLTDVDAGNAVERMAGFNLGASHLNAHVVVQHQTANGPKLVDEFDVDIKGGQLLPPLGPIGLVLHGVREFKETLAADAKKLADHVLKKLETFEKEQRKEKKSQAAG